MNSESRINPSILPSLRQVGLALLVTIAAGLVEGILVIEARAIPAPAWGGALLVAMASFPIPTFPLVLLSYSFLGIAARILRWRLLADADFRMGFALVSGVLYPPVLLIQNVRLAGFHLSMKYLVAYSIVIGGVAVAAVAGGMVFRLLRSRRTGAPVRFGLQFRMAMGILVLAVACAVHWGLFGTASNRAQQSSEAGARGDLPPNVLLISIDTLRADHLGSYGYERSTDPEISRFFQKGIRFDHAVTSVPKTRPAHIGMLTGVHPAALGVRHNHIPLPNDVPTFGETLRPHGYTTAGVVAGYPLFGDTSGLNRGFHDYRDTFFPILKVHSELAALTTLMILRKLQMIDTLERRATSVSDDALDWLGDRPPEPFFLFVHYYDPHSHFRPPARFAREIGVDEDAPLTSRWVYSKVLSGARELDEDEYATGIDLYDAEIRYTDHEVGRIFARLEELGISDHTIVVLTADHGETLFERLQSHGKIFVHGGWLNERDIHIPLLMRGPGVPKGSTTDIDASSVDIMPTVLGILGIEGPPGITGRDLFASNDAETPVVSINSSSGEDRPILISARQGGYKMTFTVGTNEEQLVYLPDDPDEQNNLLQQEPGRSAELRKAIIALPTDVIQKPVDPIEAERLRALGYIQ